MTEPENPPPPKRSRVWMVVGAGVAALLLALTVIIAVVVVAKDSVKTNPSAVAPSGIPSTYGQTQVSECKVRSNISVWTKLNSDGSVGGGEKGVTSPSISLTAGATTASWRVVKDNVLVCYYKAVYAHVKHTAGGGVTITDQQTDEKDVYNASDTYEVPAGSELVSFEIFGLDSKQPNGSGVR